MSLSPNCQRIKQIKPDPLLPICIILHVYTSCLSLDCSLTAPSAAAEGWQRNYVLIFMSKIAFTFKGTRLSGCFLITKRMPKLLPWIHFTAVFRLDCQPLVKIECWGPDLETNLFWYCFGKSISVLEELSQLPPHSWWQPQPLTGLCIALKPKAGPLGKAGLWCLKTTDFLLLFFRFLS